MAGLQTILDFCNGLEMDRRKMVGTQFTRNEAQRVSLTPTLNPWRFKLDMPNRFRYQDQRSLLEALDTLDRYSPQVLTFSNNSLLSWIFRYQGSLNTAQLGLLTVQTFVGNQLVLTNLPTIPAGRVIFEPNDLIQIGPYNYPFTSTTQVLRGTGSTVTVTTNRGCWFSNIAIGESLTVGNSCNFYMFSPNMPSYKLIPGGTIYRFGVTLNNALIEFSDSFQLYEYFEVI